MIDIYLDQNEHANQQEAIHRHITTHRKNKSFVLTNGCQFFSDIFRLWRHPFIYDKSTLETVTRRSGYIDIKWLPFGTSDLEKLKNLERHADVVWMKNGFTMVCEAKKSIAL